MPDPSAIIKLVTEMQKPEFQANDANAKLAEKMVEDTKFLEDTLSGLVDIEDFVLNNKDEVDEVIGPVMGRMPATMMDFMASIDPKYNVKKQTKGKLLNVYNPTRKMITGAQASYQELANTIEPMFPKETDTLENFFRNNRETQWKTVNLLKERIDKLNNMGWSGYENNLSTKTKKYLEKINSMPPELVPIYFGQRVKKQPIGGVK